MEQETLLEKYRVELDAAGMPVELRRDATGVTCRAHEIESGREVALQIMPAPPLDAEAREKIEADAIAAKQLNHVNIPKLYDFGFHGNDLVYVTEYFDGTTAESWVTTHGPMPVRAVLHVALQVVSALGAAAFHLITHRAIHPGNLLIVPGQTAEGDWPTIKVLNFGRIAPKLAAARRRNGGVDKSAPFASPEQVEIGRVDFRSEIFSLGCTLWSLLTGVPPFNAAGKPLAGVQMTAAMKRFRGVPKKIRRLITEMAATDPDDRPLDPVVMTDQLQNCLASVERWEAIARKVGIPATWQRRRVARPVGPLAAQPLAMAAVVLIISALAALALTKSSQVNSLWRKFAYQKPIGIPIGVPDASVTPPPSEAATPVDATTAASEADLIKNLNRPKNTANDATALPMIASVSPAATPASPVVASTNENIAATSRPSSPNESGTPTSTAAVTETAPDAPNKHESMPQIASTNESNATSAPAPSTSPNEQKTEDDSASVAESAGTSAPVTAQTGKVPRAELIELPPSESIASAESGSDAHQQTAVPRAELVEPASPAEGPTNSATDAATSDASAPPAEKMEGVPRAELIETPAVAPSKSTRRKRTPLSAPLTPSERAVIRNATRRPLVRAEGDGAMVQTPDGMVHARFVGKTPDGQWMLALPSRKIMIVPPPSEFAPR